MREELGVAALPLGDRIRIKTVHQGSLVGVAPVAGPDGWLPEGRRALRSRSKWLAKFAELEPSNERAMNELARQSIVAIEGSPDDSFEHRDGLDEMFRHFDAAALSDDFETLERLITAFLRRLPTGSIDLVTTPLRGFKTLTIMEQLAAADSIAPAEVLEGHRRLPNMRTSLNAVDVLEVLLESNGPYRREGFVVKRADSSLVFSFGGYFEPSGLGSQGLYRPRGVAGHSLSGLSPQRLRLEVIGLAASSRRQYLVSALERIQNCLWHLFDPLHFRNGDEINVIAWSGAVRSFQRIVELTWMVQTTLDDDVRRELFLGLIDLYDGFGIKPLPPLKWFSDRRSWLPADYLKSEADRTKRLREDIVDDIWSGVFTGVDDQKVELPDGRSVGKEAYCEAFLHASRNGLTHGFHGLKQQTAMRSILAVHSGIFPALLPRLAVPMLEAFLGEPNAWIRRFSRSGPNPV